MPPRPPTSHEVARLAGVSRSTVSIVLNGVTTVTIAEATRAKVLEAARQLGYVPSAAARQLASGRAYTLGLVVAYAEKIKVDAFVPQALYSLNEAAHHRGFRVIVEALDEKTSPDAYHDLVRGKQIDGLVVLNPRDDDRRLSTLVRDGFPVVTIGRIPGTLAIDVDNRGAHRDVTRRLIASGRRAIGCIAYAPLVHGSAVDRVVGWRHAMHAAGLDAEDRWLDVADFSALSGYEATQRLLARVPDLDGLVAGNDTVAFGALRALHEAGRTVPDDVAVVGFDDVPLAAFASPPLSTVRLPAVEIGRRAVTRLVDAIDGNASLEDGVDTVDTVLVVRDSCGTPRDDRS